MRCAENPAGTVLRWIELTGVNKIWSLREIIGEIKEITKMWETGGTRIPDKTGEEMNKRIPDKTGEEMNNRQCVEVFKEIREECIKPILDTTL